MPVRESHSDEVGEMWFLGLKGKLGNAELSQWARGGGSGEEIRPSEIGSIEFGL